MPNILHDFKQARHDELVVNQSLEVGGVPISGDWCCCQSVVICAVPISGDLCCANQW